jgi:hypothetical protein
LGEDARALVAEGGFKALKLRLGRDRLADDLAAIEAVRSAAGADIKLMVDFNQGLSLGDALHRCHALDGQGLTWFEEPTAYDNFAGYAQLTRELTTPVQLGENFYGPRALHQALSMGAGDYVMPDLMRIGGVTGWMRASPIAGAAGVEMSTHLYPEFSAHLMRVTETAHWLEWQDWADPILAAPFELKDGFLTVPNRPGAGLEWDEDAVRRLPVRRLIRAAVGHCWPALRTHIEMLRFDPVTWRMRSANLEQAFWSIGAGDPSFADTNARGISGNGRPDGAQMGIDWSLVAGLLASARQEQRHGARLCHCARRPGPAPAQLRRQHG